jgi:hypothetical protein
MTRYGVDPRTPEQIEAQKEATRIYLVQKAAEKDALDRPTDADVELYNELDPRNHWRCEIPGFWIGSGRLGKISTYGLISWDKGGNASFPEYFEREILREDGTVSFVMSGQIRHYRQSMLYICAEGTPVLYSRPVKTIIRTLSEELYQKISERLPQLNRIRDERRYK